MKKNLLCVLLLSFFALSSAFAQSRTITGKVTGADDGLPLPGVTVRIQGTTSGTQTNTDGSYSLAVPQGNETLIFTYIGFSTKNVAIGSKAIINVSLAPDSKALTEVVVVGYGTQERRDLTGSVGKVTGATLTDIPTPSFDKSLAGRVTGVQVTEGSGMLGDAPTIRIRGINSLSNENGPLYVLDGVPIITGNQSSVVNTNPLGDINPADIESVEVLKDGSATAIYGSRASSGVILITTKKGKAGKQTVSYNAWFGVATPSKRFDVLNADQFIQIANEKFSNYNTANGLTGADAIPPQAFPTLAPNGNAYNTDWQNYIFRNGFQENHTIAISGGTEKSNYYFSGNFADLTGDIVDNSQRKYSIRANAEQKALNILTIGFTSNVSYIKNLGLNNGYNTLSGNVTSALHAFPNVPAFNADGSYNLSPNNTLGQGANLSGIDDNYTNPKYVLDHNIFSNQNLTFNGTAYVDAKIIQGLNVRSQVGVNSLYGEDYQYWNPVHGDGYPTGLVVQQYLPSVNYDWTNTISYNKEIGKSKIGFVGGTEFQKTTQRSFNATGTGLSNVFFGTGGNIISGSLATPTIGGGVDENSIRSFFGRVNYSYNDRYLLTLTYRTDYISNLGIASAPAKLPGASLGWRVSDEDFFKEASGLQFINDLKFRLSYARTGNANIGDYVFASTYGPVQYGAQSGLAFSLLGNPSLVFEQTNKYDAGVDISLLKNRITLTADYFRDDDNNLIQEVTTPGSLGVPNNQIAENVGNMNNKGFELGISSLNISSKDFTWNTSFNITFIKNKVTKLYGGQDLTSTYNITRVGHPINSFYGFTYLGVNPANGNPLYRKGNGTEVQGDVNQEVYYAYDPKNPTDESTQSSLGTADESILGNSNPTYFGGLNNTFTYKGFDLGIYLTFSGGNKVLNATLQNDLLNQDFDNDGTAILARWTHPGQITNVPMVLYGSGTFVNQTSNASTRFLEDGKFLRAQELTLGYSLPKSFTDRIKLSKLRVYAQVQNAFIFTPYKGLDPELANYGTGVDYEANPRPRTFVLGLNVGF